MAGLFFPCSGRLSAVCHPVLPLPASWPPLFDLAMAHSTSIIGLYVHRGFPVFFCFFFSLPMTPLHASSRSIGYLISQDGDLSPPPLRF